MRRLRVTTSMKKELAARRDARGQLWRGGVMRVPAIMGAEEWEALASVSQDKLIEHACEDRAERSRVHSEPSVTGKDPDHVSHRYASSPVR